MENYDESQNTSRITRR